MVTTVPQAQATIDFATAANAHAGRVKSEYLGRGTNREWDNHIREYYIKISSDLANARDPNIKRLLKKANNILYEGDPPVSKSLKSDAERMELWKTLNETWLMSSQTIDPKTAEDFIKMTRKASKIDDAVPIWHQQLAFHAARIETGGMSNIYLDPTVEGYSYYSHHLNRVLAHHSNGAYDNQDPSWHLVYDVLYLSWLNKGKSQNGPDAPPPIPSEGTQLLPGAVGDNPNDKNHNPVDDTTEYPGNGTYSNNRQSGGKYSASSALQAAQRRIIERGTMSEQKILAATSDNAEVLDQLSKKALEGSNLSRFVKGSLLYTLLDNENLTSDSLDYIARNSKRKKTKLEVARHQNVSQDTLAYLVEDSRRAVRRVAVSSPVMSEDVRAEHSVAESLSVMAEAVKHVKDPKLIDLTVSSALEGSIMRKLARAGPGIGPRQEKVLANAVTNPNTSEATLDRIQKLAEDIGGGSLVDLVKKERLRRENVSS